MRKILCSKSFAALLAVLLLSGVSYAQIGISTMRGTVKDPQGNVVAGASVHLTKSDRNFSRTQTTSQDGSYVFTAVPPGTYVLEVEAPGFKKTSVSDVKALVDTTVDRDVTLEVGAVSEIVNVTASGEAPLNTTDATIGTTFESRRIEELVGNLSLNVDPQTGTPANDFGRYTGSQSPVGETRPGRVMQFALRYIF